MVFPRAGVGNPMVYLCGDKEHIKRGIPDFYGAGTLRTLILPLKKKKKKKVVAFLLPFLPLFAEITVIASPLVYPHRPAKWRLDHASCFPD